MRVQVRTNESKISLDNMNDDSTIEDVIFALVTKIAILNPAKAFLSLENNNPPAASIADSSNINVEILSRDQKLCNLTREKSIVLKLQGKLIKIVHEKTSIAEDGSVQPKGTFREITEVDQFISDQISTATNLAMKFPSSPRKEAQNTTQSNKSSTIGASGSSSSSNSRSNEYSLKSNMYSEELSRRANQNQNSAVQVLGTDLDTPAKESARSPALTPNSELENVLSALGNSDDGVRPADPSTRMRLIDREPNVPSLVRSSSIVREEERNVDQDVLQMAIQAGISPRELKEIMMIQRMEQERTNRQRPLQTLAQQRQYDTAEVLPLRSERSQPTTRDTVPPRIESRTTTIQPSHGVIDNDVEIQKYLKLIAQRNAPNASDNERLATTNLDSMPTTQRSNMTTGQINTLNRTSSLSSSSSSPSPSTSSAAVRNSMSGSRETSITEEEINAQSSLYRKHTSQRTSSDNPKPLPIPSITVSARRIDSNRTEAFLANTRPRSAHNRDIDENRNSTIESAYSAPVDEFSDLGLSAYEIQEQQAQLQRFEQIRSRSQSSGPTLRRENTRPIVNNLTSPIASAVSPIVTNASTPSTTNFKEELLKMGYTNLDIREQEEYLRQMEQEKEKKREQERQREQSVQRSLSSDPCRRRQTTISREEQDKHVARALQSSDDYLLESQFQNRFTLNDTDNSQFSRSSRAFNNTILGNSDGNLGNISANTVFNRLDRSQISGNAYDTSLTSSRGENLEDINQQNRLAVELGLSGWEIEQQIRELQELEASSDNIRNSQDRNSTEAGRTTNSTDSNSTSISQAIDFNNLTDAQLREFGLSRFDILCQDYSMKIIENSRQDQLRREDNTYDRSYDRFGSLTRNNATYRNIDVASNIQYQDPILDFNSTKYNFLRSRSSNNASNTASASTSYSHSSRHNFSGYSANNSANYSTNNSARTAAPTQSQSSPPATIPRARIDLQSNIRSQNSGSIGGRNNGISYSGSVSSIGSTNDSTIKSNRKAAASLNLSPRGSIGTPRSNGGCSRTASSNFGDVRGETMSRQATTATNCRTSSTVGGGSGGSGGRGNFDNIGSTSSRGNANFVGNTNSPNNSRPTAVRSPRASTSGSSYDYKQYSTSKRG